MRLDGGRGHLTYCTNIHPGERWADHFAALSRHLPAIKRMVSPGAPFGVGLRLSAAAAADLAEPATLAAFKAFLAAHDLYVFTVNGFPYGAFHGTRVKTAVYRPDWCRPERLAYTRLLAYLLADLLPEGVSGSISTVPGGWAGDDVDMNSVIANLRAADAHLAVLHERTGRRVTLALEPEPGCLLDATADAVPLFRRLDGARHLGLCLDLCHLAVGFEDPAEALALLEAEAIPVHKLQLSAGLSLAPGQADALAPFDDGVYLHQVTTRTGAGLRRYADLADAIACADARAAEEWRVHFHVPLWSERLDRMASTAGITGRMLELHAARPVCDHLEVETYTWDVLPRAHRGRDLDSDIARELEWVLERLA